MVSQTKTAFTRLGSWFLPYKYQIVGLAPFSNLSLLTPHFFQGDSYVNTFLEPILENASS